MDPVLLNLNSQTPLWELGARVLSYAAYPQGRDIKKRELYWRAVCHKHLKWCADNYPTWACDLQLIRPVHVLMTPQRAISVSKRGDRRLNENLHAADMALPFLREPIFGEPPRLPIDVKRLSLNMMAKRVLQHSVESDLENLIKRTWRPVAPALHLVCALVHYERDRDQESGMHARADIILRDAEAFGTVVTMAEYYEAHVRKVFKIKPERQLRFRIAK
jgi:hypothetical protein